MNKIEKITTMTPGHLKGERKPNASKKYVNSTKPLYTTITRQNFINRKTQ